MGGWSGIGVGIGQSASDIARGILEAREAKEQRDIRATEMRMRTAKRSIGQPILGADGKYRQIVEDPQTGQRTVEEVVGLPAAPSEYKGLHIDPNTGDAYAVMVPSTGGSPKLEKVMTAASPEKLSAEAYKLIEGISNKEVQAAAKQKVDSAISLGRHLEAYDSARKSLDSFQQSTQIASRAGIRAETERRLRAEEAPSLVAQGILTEQEALAYIAFGKGAVPRVYQTVGTEMQQRVNEITGMLETVPVPVYRTTISGISMGGRGVAPSAGAVQPPRRVIPPLPPNRQVRYPEPVRAELSRLDTLVKQADTEINKLKARPILDKIGMPDPAATQVRIAELQKQIGDSRQKRDAIVGNVPGVTSSMLDLTKPFQVKPVEQMLPIAVFMHNNNLTPVEQAELGNAPNGDEFLDRKKRRWRKQGGSMILVSE